MIDVRDVTIAYEGKAVVYGISFSVGEGQCLGIVGESGSGKSQTGLAIMGLLPRAAQMTGAIELDGQTLTPAQRREVSAMVFQDPQSSFCPHMRLGAQLYEAMGTSDEAALHGYLRQAGLPDPKRVARSYPHELSGGMRQRAMLAMALARQPKLIIADEPTTALDASVQLALLKEFTAVKAAGVALILVSHDIGVVAGLADEIAVMKAGEIVEVGPAQTILSAPRHSYTKALIAASVLERGTQASPPKAPPLIEARGLSKTYQQPRPHPFAKASQLTALAAIDLTVHRGETLAVVGESGSGKSTLATLLLGLTPPSSGQVLWNDRDIAAISAADLRQLRRRVQPIFQDPFASFDPQRTLGQSIQDMSDLHKTGQRVEALLEAVNLPAQMARAYPHEASGGQNQRAAIARALAAQPDVLVCDEALSALDKTTQAQVLDLLAQIKAARDLAMVFISHDLDVVSAIADRIIILKEGVLVEEGSVTQIFDESTKPYTRALVSAQTVPDVAAMRARISAV